MISQKKIGLFIAYISLGLNTVISLFLAPYLVNLLGSDSYGVYKTVNSFVGYMYLLNFGVGVIIIRYVAKYTYQKRQEELKRFMGMMAIVTAVMVVGMMCIGICIYSSMGVLLKNTFTVEQLTQAKIICFLSALNIAFVVVSSYFDGYIVGFEKFAVSKIFTLLKIVLKPILVIVVLKIFRSCVILAAIDLACIGLVLLLEISYCVFKLNLRISFHSMDKSIVKETVSFSLANMLQAFINQVNLNMDSVILGSMEGPKIVTLYSIALVIFGTYSSIVGVIGNIYTPQATKLYASGATGEQLTDLVVKPGRYQFIIGGACLFGFILFGKNFLIVWMGENYLGAYWPTVIMLAPLLITSIQSVCISILDAMLKRLMRSVALALIAILNLLVSILLVSKIGYIGAAIGTGLSIFIGHDIFMNYYYQKYIKLNVFRMFKEIFKGIMPSLLITSVCMIPLSLFVSNSLIGLGIKIIAFCIEYVVLLWVIGLNKSEKQIVLHLTKKIFRKG